jgi:hypothetical protein
VQEYRDVSLTNLVYPAAKISHCRGTAEENLVRGQVSNRLSVHASRCCRGRHRRAVP